MSQNSRNVSHSAHHNRRWVNEWKKEPFRPSELDCDLFSASLATENPKERPSCGSPAAWRQIKCQFPELLPPNALIISLFFLVYVCRFNFHKYQRDTLALCNKSNEFRLRENDLRLKQHLSVSSTPGYCLAMPARVESPVRRAIKHVWIEFGALGDAFGIASHNDPIILVISSYSFEFCFYV